MRLREAGGVGNGAARDVCCDVGTESMTAAAAAVAATCGSLSNDDGPKNTARDGAAPAERPGAEDAASGCFGVQEVPTGGGGDAVHGATGRPPVAAPTACGGSDNGGRSHG